MLKVRIAGRANPLTSHCGKEIPNLLVAAQEMWKKIEKELGSDAVAEGRRRDGAELEAAAPTAAPAASEATRPADQPLNFFLHSKLVRELDAKLVRANDRVIVADGAMRAAQLRVAEEEKAVKLAQQRLADARAAADVAKEPLAEAKAEAAELRASLEQLRSKRQRLAAEQPPTSAGASAAASAQTQAVVDNDPPHYDNYKDYSFATFRMLEARQMQRRSVVPQRGVQAEAPKRGQNGAMEHWRHGLVGAVQAWAGGSLENVIKLVMKLVLHFEIASEIRELLPSGDAAPALAAPSLARATAN